MGWNDGLLEGVVGATVKQIFMDEDRLVFVTDKGNIGWDVEGDCCSSSYFHDFIGVKKLLAGNPIVRAGEVSELPDKLEYDDSKDDMYSECIQVYGYEFVTEDPKYGEVTSVMAFRNSSNGYYGGWMNRLGDDPSTEGMTEIKRDVLGE